MDTSAKSEQVGRRQFCSVQENLRTSRKRTGRGLGCGSGTAQRSERELGVRLAAAASTWLLPVKLTMLTLTLRPRLSGKYRPCTSEPSPHLLDSSPSAWLPQLK